MRLARSLLTVPSSFNILLSFFTTFVVVVVVVVVGVVVVGAGVEVAATPCLLSGKTARLNKKDRKSEPRGDDDPGAKYGSDADLTAGALSWTSTAVSCVMDATKMVNTIKLMNT